MISSLSRITNYLHEEEAVEETGDTCEANALLKARAIPRDHDLIIIEEDSGLFIEALNGPRGRELLK
ncbi:non-canonical purine NTP pyrophosphatase [Bacillus sp. FJAT-27264]|uniref:non-canonical purine NTP pyrophosphatase n=1 Tax=Paenibacillus sp. (strain DSM 101736 / FJAT-27264) TaxID=1850362 RepID=UPI001586392D